jgi:hypothetical protein
MGRRGIFHTYSLLGEIEGHFIHEFVTYVYETPGLVHTGTTGLHCCGSDSEANFI